MERSSDGRILVVADTSFLVNFLAINRMDILHQLRDYAFHAPNHVIEEVKYPDQLERLKAAINGGTVTEFEIIEASEIVLYDQLQRILGDGESACLAVAASRQWVIAADEKGRLKREIFERLGEHYLLNTPGAIVTALRSGILSVSDAENIRREMGNRFVMDIPPFENLA